jgi:hypothetical protein
MSTTSPNTLPASAPTSEPNDPDLLVGTLYLRKEDLARELRCTTRQIERIHESGLGPPRFRIGKRYYYSRESVLAWLKSLEQPRSASPRRRRQKPAVA